MSAENKINDKFKSDSFKTPEGYFEELNASILNKIEAEENEDIIQFTERTKRTSLVKMLFAACFLGFALFFLMENNEEQIVLASEDIIEEVMNYDEELIIDALIDENLLADLNETTINIEEEIILENYLTEEDIINEL